MPLSLALGWRAGLAHLVAVAAAWSYNLWLKGTVLSWLPFALAFGLLPAVVTLALDPPVAPPWWLVAAGALLGVGAHLVNVLPDLEDDRATGINGFGHRIGRRATAVLAPLVLVAATVLVVARSGRRARPGRVGRPGRRGGRRRGRRGRRDVGPAAAAARPGRARRWSPPPTSRCCWSRASTLR